LIFEKNTPIPMSDGLDLMCNVFRPDAPGNYPVIMSFGVYGKDVHFEDGFNPQWKKLKAVYPEVDQGESTGEYLRWEVPDPQRWVPDNFVIVVVDSRGSGMSPGYLDLYSPRETQDYYEAIEWAAVQSWSNGKVGLSGISYLAIKQWQVAALQPPHLAAMIPWEGAVDHYRDLLRHGGILSNSFTQAWWPRQILANQHGNGQTTHIDRQTKKITTGEPLPAAQLIGNRSDYPAEIAKRSLWDAWFSDHTARLDRVTVPLLSAANWGGAGIHLRGNFSGYLQSASTEKWLFAHIGTHYESFYLPHYVAIQKRFFNHYLKGEENGWQDEPRVQLAIRAVDGTAKMRKTTAWPLPETEWQKWYLDGKNLSVSNQTNQEESKVAYQALGDGITFRSPAFKEDTEFTGNVKLKLFVSSSTTDMDVFAILRCFDPQGQEVEFIGAHENVPVACGWLRASHRKLDATKSSEYLPYHRHDEIQKLVPDEIYELDIEILPTSLVFPKDYTLAITVMGRDFNLNPQGRILHNDLQDRNETEFGGISQIYTGGNYASYLLMPRIRKD